MKNVIIPDKLLLDVEKSIRELCYFSLGEMINRSIFKESNEEFQVRLRIVNNPLKYFVEPYKQFSTNYKVGVNSIYYRRKYGGIKCEMSIINLKSNRFQVFVNKNYLRFVRFKVDGLYPIGIHLMDLLLLKIIDSGDLVIHAASLYNSKTKDAFLLVAPPDTGKTYTTYMLLKEDFKFLGEDLSYYNKKYNSLLCMPLTSTWGHRFEVAKKRKIEKIPFLSLFIESTRKIATEIFNESIIKRKAKLSRIYILEKSSENKVEKIEISDELIRKIMIIQRNEFSYYKNPLLRAFDYFNSINVDIIFEKEKENLKEMLKNKNIYLVSANNHKSFPGLILKNEKLINAR